MPIQRVFAPRIDFDVLRRELKLPGEFPPEALAEAQAAAGATPMPAADLTDVPFVTIDPATSRDLDQAMHLSRRGSGYRVRYAIADVASYVRPGGPLEAETWVRGQTIYLPDGRIPLHPAVLSEDAVSLFPDVDRAAVVWTIDLDADGAIVAVSLQRARVRSRAKLDYAGVQAEVDAGTAAEPYALLPELGALLAERAAARGAINLPLPEQEVEPDGDGWRLVLRAPLAVEEHNAQISLLTGMAAADLMLAGGIGLLRTMPAARPDAVAKLRAAARSLGVRWPQGASVGAVVAEVDPGSPRGRRVPGSGRGVAAGCGVHGVRRCGAGRDRARRGGRAVRARHRAAAPAGRPVRHRGVPGVARGPAGAGVGARGAARAAEGDGRHRPAGLGGQPGRGVAGRGRAAGRPGRRGLRRRRAGRGQQPARRSRAVRSPSTTRRCWPAAWATCRSANACGPG